MLRSGAAGRPRPARRGVAWHRVHRGSATTSVRTISWSTSNCAGDAAGSLRAAWLQLPRPPASRSSHRPMSAAFDTAQPPAATQQVEDVDAGPGFTDGDEVLRAEAGRAQDANSPLPAGPAAGPAAAAAGPAARRCGRSPAPRVRQPCRASARRRWWCPAPTPGTTAAITRPPTTSGSPTSAGRGNRKPSPMADQGSGLPGGCSARITGTSTAATSPAAKPLL